MLNMVILSGYYCCERLDKTFSCDDDDDDDGERTNERETGQRDVDAQKLLKKHGDWSRLQTLALCGARTCSVK